MPKKKKDNDNIKKAAFGAIGGAVAGAMAGAAAAYMSEEENRDAVAKKTKEVAGTATDKAQEIGEGMKEKTPMVGEKAPVFASTVRKPKSKTKKGRK